MTRTLTRFALYMLFLVALLVSGLPPSHAQDEPVLDTFTVTVPTANVRAGPSTDYAVVSVARSSDQFDVLDQAQVGSHVWYKLALPGGASGWMRGDLGVYHEAPRIVATPPQDDAADTEPSGQALDVGERFYLGSIDQDVTVMYVDRYMRLLMPDKMGGAPGYYQPIEKIEVNPEYTPEQMEQNIWSVYWPQVYFDLIHNGRRTPDGQSYAEALGLRGNITREAVWEALQAREGNWPLIPYRYKWGSNGREDLYAEGYANPNLPINIIPLPRNMTPPAFGNEPVKPWIRIDSYKANLVVPNSAVGVLVDSETGQIRLYTGLHEEKRTAYLGMLLYRAKSVFTTDSGIKPILAEVEPWYYDWYDFYLKDAPPALIIS